MNIACWNCGGIKSNFVYMQKLLESVDVLAISEHWLYHRQSRRHLLDCLWLYADELTILDNLHNDFLYYAKISEQNNMNTRWKRGQGGVAIVWKKHLKAQRLLLGNDRIVAIKFRMNNQNYVFCSIYFPSTNSNLADFIDTLTCLNAVCTQLSYREEQISIAGDFNVHVSDPRSGQRENNRGKLLLEMFAEFDMFPVNVDMPCMGPLFTYYSSCGNSVVDYIFASRNIERIVKCVKVGDEHPCNLSYHLPLIAGIEIFAGINCHESSNNLENEYERIAWRKCASEQVLEY